MVTGVVKTSTTVFPEPRDSGYCARIETHVEKVSALGIVNMEVTCQGAMLVGALEEPIKDTKSPMSKVIYGVPYNGRIKSLTFDYKADVGHETVRGTGFSPLKNMGYPDYPSVTVILQKRWEVGYGDITGEEYYEDYMGLNNDEETAYHCINSSGKNVVVEETGWASPDEQPNYLIVIFLSSSGKAFYGGIGNTLWIDNVRLERE